MESSSFSGDSTSAGSEREEGRWVVPLYLHWSTEEVAEWVESLGFNQYKVGTNCLEEGIDLGGWPGA